MATTTETYRQKLKDLLRELFQFDSADLDFGIYAILNQRREQINHFIEHDLLDAVLEGLEIERTAQSSLTQEELEQARQQLINTIGPQALDPRGNVVATYKQASFFDLPVVRQAVTGYESAKAAYETGQLEAETEAHVYNDLYRFFARYYDDGDFISQRRFGPDRYAVPYSGQEVYLHWANADQYYIKTGERFSNYTFTLPPTVSDQSAEVVFFRLQKAETDRDNTKSSDKRFFILNPETPYQWDESSRVLTLNFEYRALTPAESERAGSRNQQDKLNEEAVQTLARTLPNPYLKAQLLQPDSRDTDRSRFIRHLHRYTARHTRDYFIHKNLAPFLRQELDYFLNTEVLRLDDLDLKNPVQARLALARVRVIRHIAHYIIAFLAQIENFQKRLFEKRKFVLQSDYCLTLDRIPEAVRDELYAALLHNEPQLQVWRELYALDQTEPTLFNPKVDLTNITEEFLKLHPHLMLDTAYLEPDLKAKLLANFDNLDTQIDGLLFHSENFQALNLLLLRYRGQIKCIYIDPPYNTGGDEFIYKDAFQHSSWLAMMENRLNFAREILTEDGAIFVSIDDNEQNRLVELMGQIFEIENYLASIVWKRTVSQPISGKAFATQHEYLVAYSKSSGVNLSRLKHQDTNDYKNPDNDPRGPYKLQKFERTLSGARPTMTYPIETPVGIIERTWSGPRRTYEELLADNRIAFSKSGMPYYKQFQSEVEGVNPPTLWQIDQGYNQHGARELVNLFGAKVYDTVKPINLLKRIMEICTTSNSLTLDFFAGSGTTGHTIMNLNQEDMGNRKYILIEMGAYFNTVLKPRLQKVAYAAEWRDGHPVTGSEGQSHIFQYLRLESYDDTLSNIVFKDRRRQPSLFDLLDDLADYRLHYMLDFETEESPVLLNLAQFSRPFDYHLQAQPVDLVTTFNFLLGLRLETQREFTWETGRVVRVVGLNPQGQRLCVIWRNTPEVSQLEAEKAWLQSEVLAGLKVDILFINGESLLPGAQPLEPEFQRLMFASVTPTPPVEVN